MYKEQITKGKKKKKQIPKSKLQIPKKQNHQSATTVTSSGPPRRMRQLFIKCIENLEAIKRL